MDVLVRNQAITSLVATLLVAFAPAAVAADDSALLDTLLENGAITQEQYDSLAGSAAVSSEEAAADAGSADTGMSEAELDAKIDARIADDSPVKTSYGDKGFRLESRDGNFQTNLQWRAQFRYSNPRDGDPRQIAAFEEDSDSDFKPRRLRMKIGGHGFKPWLKYYFEVDLQPTADPEADAQSSGARVITWRADVAKWKAATLRLGQWKIDYNRERVDSSGRQQFVERSIVNRVFTIDRQIGMQLRGHLFEGSRADMRYYAGIYNGEGRGFENEGDYHMYSGRLQWNFLKRDLKWRQSDVKFHEEPTGSFALAATTNTGRCTRWSTSGCGRLDGFESPLLAEEDQYETNQWVQEIAFKYRGLSIQQEYHQKKIDDKVNANKFDLDGLYVQTGYFFHGLWDAFPEKMELALRYAELKEPNSGLRAGFDPDDNPVETTPANPNIDNKRKEYTAAINYFFNGHRNKLTFDYSYLTLDNGLYNDVFGDKTFNEDRVRLQWDVSF